MPPPAPLSALLASRELRFLVVGAGNTVFGLALFAGLHLLLEEQVGYLVLLVLTYAIGVVVAFTTQRLLVFKVEGTVLADFARFVLVQAGAFATNAVVLALLVEVLGLPVLLGQLVAVCVLVVVTYFGHLLFSFRREATP